MDLFSVLSHLIKVDKSLPVIKLAWEDQIEGFPRGKVPPIPPSHYIQELRMTTEERTAILCRQQRTLEFWRLGVALNITPAVIVFQHSTPGSEQVINMSIQNISGKSQKVTLYMDDSTAFSVDAESTRVQKFAPGMSMSVSIKFTPREEVDHFHKVVLTTEYSRICIPIISFGATSRGILDLPDLVDFGRVPVKYCKTLKVSAVNISDQMPARFTVETFGNFCVTPEKGVVAAKDSFIFSVAFCGDRALCYIGDIRINYENGEQVVIRLRGEAINSDMALEPSDLVFDGTYKGLTTERVVRLTNGSKVPIRYKWRNEVPVLQPLPIDFGGSGDSPMISATPIQKSRSKGRSKQTLKAAEAATIYEETLFYHECFSIVPPMGEIRPNSTTEFRIFFSPLRAELFETVLMCEVIGSEDRLPLRVSGTGLGPKFRFAFDELDVGTVYLNCPHTYELPISNTSEIDGKISYIGSVCGTSPDSHICIEPLEMRLAPGEFAGFLIHFIAAGKPEPFVDQLIFFIAGSDEKIYVNLRGEKAYPRLKFSADDINFGKVSIGFPKIQEIVLSNESLHSVPIHLALDKDGGEPSASVDDILASFDHPGFTLPSNPKEFAIEPADFILKPKGIQRISVRLCSNACQTYERSILVSTDNDKKEDVIIYELPVKGACTIPKIENLQPEMILEHVYKDNIYPAKFKLQNSSDLSVIYCITPKKNSEVKVKSENFRGIFGPREIKTIPFDINSSTNGCFQLTFELFLLGDPKSHLRLTMEGNSCDLILEVNPTTLDFGSIRTLEAVEATIDVYNPTHLTVFFNTQIPDTEFGEEWNVSPSEGQLKGKSKIRLNVSVTLKEGGLHQNLLRILTPDLKKSFEVKLLATGVRGRGSAITFAPDLPDDFRIDFNTIYTRNEKKVIYEVRNDGPFPKILQWRHEKDEPPVNPAIMELLGEIPKVKAVHHHRRPSTSGSSKLPSAGSTPSKTSIVTKASTSSKSRSSVTTPGSKLSNTPSAGSSMAPSTAPSTPGGPGPVKNPRRTVFTISPSKLFVRPGSSAFLEFKASSKKEMEVKERFVLWVYTPKPAGSESQSVTSLSASEALLNARDCPQCDLSAQPRNYCARHQAYIPEVVKKVKLIASFLEASLRKSKKAINFRLEPTPLERDFQIKEDIQFENMGQLPLKVTFSTGDPFSIHVPNEEEPFVNELSLTLAPSEEINLTINFNGSELRREGGDTRFSGELVMVYEGNFDGSDYVPLKAEIVPPSLKFDRKSINFGVIPNGTEAIEEIFVENEGNYCLLYKWYIKQHSTRIEVKGGVSAEETEPFPAPDPEKIVKTRNEADEEFIKSLVHRKSSSKGSRPKSASSKTSDLDDLGPNTEFFELLNEKMYRSKFMAMVGLEDPSHEVEDELDYLHLNRSVPSSQGDGVAINEVLDIIPMAGVIQAGQSQEFSVVFYGIPGVKFSCQAVCHIEGGISRVVDITGEAADIALVLEGPKDVKDGGPVTEKAGKIARNLNLIKNLTEPRAYQFTVDNGGQEPIDIQVDHRPMTSGYLDIRPRIVSIAPGGQILVHVSRVLEGELTEDVTNFCLEMIDCDNPHVSVGGDLEQPSVSIQLPPGGAEKCGPIILLLSPAGMTFSRTSVAVQQDSAVATPRPPSPDIISEGESMTSNAWGSSVRGDSGTPSEVGSEIFDEEGVEPLEDVVEEEKEDVTSVQEGGIPIDPRMTPSKPATAKKIKSVQK